ncbi:MAG TPA: glycoside hydrolase domain-containing protein [Bacillales bacterium]|nr:glycoside hydrolase domain-containing protein [Bacillales bacterium]
MPRRTVWGVDSARRVTNNLYQCVVDNYGSPRFWGRYLQSIEGQTVELTQQEVRFLHNKGIKILPIYLFQGATGYRHGKVIAHNAVFTARRLGIPKGTFLFADLERGMSVDEAWIRGYVDAMFPAGFRPGIYCDPTRSDFNRAYCTAVRNNSKVADQVVIWSQEPTPGVTKKRNAPKYNPAKPSCKANVWGWQYGENAPECPIDTNLIDSRLLNNLY